jgi:heme/copper-type cytochrome/quinol oxidase subunit 3
MSGAQAMTVIPWRPPGARRDATAALGMLLFLGSWAMLFGSLFFSYAMVRAHAGSWPPAETPRLPLALPGFSTLVIASSSFFLQRALSAARAGRGGQVLPQLCGAAALGALFLALQSLLWTRLWRAGLRPEDGPYPSVFWALTVFHALHVLVGLFGLAFVGLRAARGLVNAGRHVTLRLWTAYWHFVGAVWVLLYVAVFVL